MLEDDELDFDDFGDLEGYEGQNLTTEELEKQLALEFDDLSDIKPEQDKSVNLDEGEIVENSVEKKEESTKSKPEGNNVEVSTQSTEVPSQSTKVTSNSTEVSSNPTEVSSNSTEAPSKPVHKQQQQNYYNNNFYNQQYTPDMMPMNMFPYPQFSNRIYVNPKFNGGQVNQQQILQQQQMAQQRQYMEMEAKRMALLQHQQQLLVHKNLAAELDKKRKETAEMMRKRKELKATNGHNDSQAGEKRKLDTDSTESDHDPKRQLRQSSAGGISIKGAAAAAAARGIYPTTTPPPPRNTPYTPPHLKKAENDIRNRIGKTPDITSRLSRPEERKKPTPTVPIVTGGKSNTLTINGFTNNINENDIKNMTKDIPGGAQDIKINQDNKSVTVVFPTIEAAVTFRRKFNRFQIGEGRINVVFQK